MATVKITLSYEETFRRDENTDASAIRATLKPGRGWHSGNYELTVDVTANGPRVDVRLGFSASTDETQSYNAERRLKGLLAHLNAATSERFREWRASSNRDIEMTGIGFEHATPVVAIVEVPLLAEDRDVVVDDLTLRHLLVRAVEDTYPFWRDQRERTDAIESALAYGAITVSASDPTPALEVASAYLSATRRPVRPKPRPRRPVWAAASALVAFLSFGLSWLSLSWLSLAVFVCPTALISLAAIYWTPRLGAKRTVTTWGMAPVLALSTFAVVYGAIALLSPTTITLHDSRLRFLREPFLLSLSLLNTGGVLDLEVHGWARSLAYLEMLLVAGLAGGAALVAARRLFERAGAIVEELRLDRRG
jgi:hypothetical protein